VDGPFSESKFVVWRAPTGREPLSDSVLLPGIKAAAREPLADHASSSDRELFSSSEQNAAKYEHLVEREPMRRSLTQPYYAVSTNVTDALIALDMCGYRNNLVLSTSLDLQTWTICSTVMAVRCSWCSLL
jgi:hypothetical protein